VRWQTSPVGYFGLAFASSLASLWLVCKPYAGLTMFLQKGLAII